MAGRVYGGACQRLSVGLWRPGPEPGVPSDGGTFPGAPRPVARVSVLGWLFPALPRVCPYTLGWVPLGHQTQSVIGTDHKRERHGRAGNRGTRELPRPASPPSWEGYGRIPSTWLLREKLLEREGGVGGGCQGPRQASSSAAGPGETTVRPFSQRLAPPRLGQASLAPPALTLQGQVPSPRAAARGACADSVGETPGSCLPSSNPPSPRL